MEFVIKERKITYMCYRFGLDEANIGQIRSSDEEKITIKMIK